MTEANVTTKEVTHGVGMIGLGAIGREMLEVMSLHPHFTVRAAWDPDPAVMRATLQDSPSVLAAASAAEVLSAPGVDILYVASPPATHAQYVHLALDAGLALLCEKPLGVDLQVSRRVVERVAELGALNAVNFNHAAAFDAETVKRWLGEGELGRPSHVVMHLHLPQWPRAFQTHARWLAGREQGGFSREMLSHWLFLSRKLLGGGEIVQARTRYDDDAQASEVAVVAELDFAGTPAYVTAAVGGAGPVGMQYTLYADAASVRLTSGGGLARWDGHSWLPVADAPDEVTGGDRGRALTQFAALLSGAANTCASVADAFAVQELVEGILSSAHGPRTR